MYENQKSNWIDFIESYKEMSFLWDPKNQDYTNKDLRNEGNEKLFQIYKKIDDRGMLHMKKKIDSMRTTYNRERKKIKLSRKSGVNYIPTLWYFKYLSFLDGTVGTQKKNMYHFSFNRHNNQIILEKRPAVNLDSEDEDDEDKLRNIEPVQSSDEEENTENIQPSPPKRIHDLLQKQQEFVETASKILTKKEEDWQVIGKAIGLQLYNLEPEQRIIARKLISDAIYYGTMEKLTVESCVQVENVETESFNDTNECVLYVESSISPSSDYE